MADGGAIINVTSGAAGRATWGAYAVSKLALDGITAMLREELADRAIRCVAVNPGRAPHRDARGRLSRTRIPPPFPHPSSVVRRLRRHRRGGRPGPARRGRASGPGLTGVPGRSRPSRPRAGGATCRSSRWRRPWCRWRDIGPRVRDDPRYHAGRPARGAAARLGARGGGARGWPPPPSGLPDGTDAGRVGRLPPHRDPGRAVPRATWRSWRWSTRTGRPTRSRTAAARYVTPPSRSALAPPPHLTGGAVDLTLGDGDGPAARPGHGLRRLRPRGRRAGPRGHARAARATCGARSTGR